jgi:hypothetical protein
MSDVAIVVSLDELIGWALAGFVVVGLALAWLVGCAWHLATRHRRR